MDSLSVIATSTQGEGHESVKADLTHAIEGVHSTHSGDAEGGRVSKPIGRPVSTGNVETTYGGTNASVHIKRLERIAAEEPNPRKRDLLLAACQCIRVLAAKNRRMGAKVGALTKRAVLSKRGVQLSDTSRPEDIASDIVDLANQQAVHVYIARKRFRVTTSEIPLSDERFRVGTYDAACDYRAVLDDVREALRAKTARMDPETKAAGCLGVLNDGPATTAEVGVALGITSRLACTHLFLLERRGKVTKTPFGTGKGRTKWLWSLAEQAA